MALLRLENGEIFTDISKINELVTPMEIGAFNVPADFLAFANDPTTKFNRQFANRLYNDVATGVERLLARHNFTFQARRIGIYVPPVKPGDSRQFITLFDSDAEVEPTSLRDEDFKAYMTPHRFPVLDFHFCFAGTMAKGLKLQNGTEAVIYIFPGEWMRVRPTVLNWPIFQSGSPVVGLSYFAEKENEHGAYDMELHPEYKPKAVTSF
ncbi:hypothetical protein A0U92_02690 [Acetobacter aceti]|uniref:Uncharacterized protein n=1 Tax=Acetobacter aceti TaxID=435 RepID=A0A1U9KDK3_ACEAC|nr:hypothetical protein [Acetobacter aceti]AQS83862.1 hypothetical protein A0U92_02690 [Acetobacter aceti]